MWKKPEQDKDWLALEQEKAEPKPKPAAAAPAPASQAPHQIASIGSSIRIRGDISGDEDLMVNGRIEGSINLPKNNIVVGADGEVNANLHAMKISVEGRVKGDLHASEQIVVRRSGRVEGNISAPRVALEDGCRFKGTVEMNLDERGRPDTGGAKAQAGAKLVTGTAAGPTTGPAGPKPAGTAKPH